MLSRRTLQRSLAAAALLAVAGQVWAQPADRLDGVPQAVEGQGLEALLFYVFGGVVALSAFGVCLSKQVVRMATCLFGALGSVAALYLLLSATFLAAIQLIVYVGGTLILLVFGVMLTTRSPWVRFECRRVEVVAATIVGVVLAIGLVAVVTATSWPTTPEVVPGTSVAQFGKELLTTYLVPFEVASVLLLVVMIGAAYLARQEE